ncbi:hypothetical protein ACCO45_004002 [Purpureocillium lilacinum]
MEFSDKIGEQRGSYTRVPTTCQGDASLCQACPCLAGQNRWTGAPDVVGPVNGLPPTTWRGATCMYLEVPGQSPYPTHRPRRDCVRVAVLRWYQTCATGRCGMAAAGKRAYCAGALHQRVRTRSPRSNRSIGSRFWLEGAGCQQSPTTTTRGNLEEDDRQFSGGAASAAHHDKTRQRQSLSGRVDACGFPFPSSIQDDAGCLHVVEHRVALAGARRAPYVPILRGETVVGEHNTAETRQYLRNPVPLLVLAPGDARNQAMGQAQVPPSPLLNLR